MNAPDRLPPHSPQRIVLIEIEKMVRAKSINLYDALNTTLDRQQIANALFNLKKAERIVADEGGWYTITARGRECLRASESVKATRPEGSGSRVNDPAALVSATEHKRAADLTAQLRTDNGHIEKTIAELERQMQHHEAAVNKLRNLINDLRQFTRTA